MAQSYILCKSLDQLKKYLELFASAQFWGFDFESTGLNVRKDHPVGLSLSPGIDQAIYIPFDHALTECLPYEETMGVVREMLDGKTIIMQNAKFDCEMAYQTVGWDIWKTNKIHDTMIMGYVTGRFVKFGDAVKIGLKSMVKEVFGYDMVTIQELFGSTKKKDVVIDMVSKTGEEVYMYACDDAMYTLSLFRYFGKQIANSPTKFMYQIEMKLVPVVQKMERYGIRLDVELMKEISGELWKEFKDLEQLVFEQVGEAIGTTVSFGIGSTKDVAEILYDYMKLPVLGMTEKGNRKTDKFTLAKLATKYPVVQNILTWRRLSKQISSYTDTLADYVEEDGRIHCGFMQAHNAAGRFASNHPNLQNQPKKGKAPFIIRTKDGKREFDTRIREAFVPAEGHYFLEVDESQIEYRILVAEAGQFDMVRAFNEGVDFHKKTAADMFGIPLDQVMPIQRVKGKTINFGIIYGEGPGKLAEQIEVSMEEAKRLMSIYFEARPAIKNYKSEKLLEARRQKYVETHFHRRVYLSQYETSDRRIQSAGDRVAFNSIISGTAADVLKIAMVEVDRVLTENFEDMVKILLTVHDSLLFEVPNDIKPEDVLFWVRPAMTTFIDQYLEGYPKLVLDAEIGKSWGTLESFEGKSENVVESHQMSQETSKEEIKGEGGGEDKGTCEAPQGMVLEVPFNCIYLVPDSDSLEESAIDRIIQLLAKNPGMNIIVFKVGEEEFPVRNYPTSLGLDDQALLSTIVPCKLFVKPKDVVKKSLVDGLDL